MLLTMAGQEIVTWCESSEKITTTRALNETEKPLSFFLILVKKKY